MPVASIDFALAASAMVLLTVGAMYGVNMGAEPFLHYDSNVQIRYYQIGRYILLAQGAPSNWGVGGAPTDLGLASEGDNYELDIDKISRLNPLNDYSVNYTALWESLDIEDVTFRISVETLFDVSLSLDDSQVQGEQTMYNFSVTVMREGRPLVADVSYYVAVRDTTQLSSGTTDGDGAGTTQFTLPNSQNGSAVLIALVDFEGLVSYDVLPFAHNSGAPEPAGTYTVLSPMNYILTVNLTPGANVINAVTFSRDYAFNLTADGSDYLIPRLLDPSPIINVVTGSNASDYWVEWVAYPQIPLEIGADMSADYLISDVSSASYIVSVKGVSYRFIIEFRSPEEHD